MSKYSDKYKEKERNKKHRRSRYKSRSRSRSSCQSSSSSESPLLSPKRKNNGNDNKEKKIEWGRKEDFRKEKEKKEEPKVEIEKPNFEPSGILAKFTNSVNGTVLKFTEPIDAKKPNDFWKIFPFKGNESLDVINLKTQSCFLFGKDRRVADIPLDHPSVSSQQAVIQFRNVTKEDEFGSSYHVVIPYLMDLESTNGTFLNGDKIEGAKYYELKHQDVIKFANSSRDFVVMKQK